MRFELLVLGWCCVVLCRVVLSCVCSVVSDCVGCDVLRCVVWWFCWFEVCCVDLLVCCLVLSFVVCCFVVGGWCVF